MTMQPCGALLPPLQDAGWECNGTGLIVVLTWLRLNDPDIPIVLPRRALEIIDPEPWWDSPIVDFTGGDHAHLCVPRRPARMQTNGVMVRGNSSIAYQANLSPIARSAFGRVFPGGDE